MKDPKVLVFDIESAPILAYVWGTREQDVALNQIHTDSYILAWAAKWLGSPASEVMYADQRNAKPISDDKALLKKLWKLLDEADIVITHYGRNFDAPKLNARFIMHGMRPPSPYKHLDTHQIVARVTKFTSNKLEYLTEKLCTRYKKLSHEKFPGMSLWTECLNGNMAAWREMKTYNVHDVLSTEELYTKVRAWVPESSPAVYHVDKIERKCPVCGKMTLERRGTHRNKAVRRLRMMCTNCGVWRLGEKVEE